MIHLHLHSHFSVLDGLGKPEQIVKKAKELGATAVAITDHANVSCIPDFFKHARESGIKPILGCEFYVTDEVDGVKGEKRHHLIVLAKSWSGVRSIMKHLSQANRQFYHRPRLQWEQVFDFEDCIISTACSSGVLAHKNYEELVRRFKGQYGDDFYLEIMPLKIESSEEGGVEDARIDYQRIVNDRAIEMSEKYGIKLLATNDAHYVNKEDAFTQELLLAIQSKKPLSDPTRWRFEADTLYMMGLNEIVTAFKSLGYLRNEKIMEAVKSAYEIADKVNIEMPKFKVDLPTPFPERDDDEVFQGAIMKGWGELVVGKVPNLKEYMERLTYEVGVIKKLGYLRYFLIVQDIIEWSRSQGIMVGAGRGSAAGSLVCYLMGITQVDPLKFGLIFERFLNPERVDLPDIDVDFQDNRRGEVVRYIRDKYGWDKTAQINTFGFLKMKSAFQDVCRAYGINHLLAQRLTKQMPDDADENVFEDIPDLASFKRKNPDVVEQTLKLVGTIRQQGMHAAGVIVSSQPIEEVAVLEYRKDGVVVNWDKRECENFGLLKMDILGLSTLTVLNEAKRLIKQNHGIDLEYTDIPLDDEATCEAFAKGEGIGVFQFENSGMQHLLKSLRAKDFDTITDCTALFRPGSLQSGQTEEYEKIANGEHREFYPTPELKPILEPTRAQMVYQEQIMRIFVELAGFTWAESDKMRKIIGKKLGKDEFEKHREHFVTGCKSNSVDEAVANELFDKMVEFANYSFNKSHAVSYTLISFWNMYIKKHYPLEFMAGLMSYASKDDKIGVYVREAKKLGVNVILPDINRSSESYLTSPVENAIVAPLGIVKGVGEKAVAEIIRARGEEPFRTMDDMLERVTKRVVNKRVIEALSMAGALEKLGVKETDPEVRVKNMTELLPIYDEMPSIKLRTMDIDPMLVGEAYKPIMGYYSERPFLQPVTGKKPKLMWINNNQQNEVEHLKAEGTLYLVKKLKEAGFTKGNMYYTGLLKHYFAKEEEPDKEYMKVCMDVVRTEISTFNPSLVICSIPDVVYALTGEKGGIKALNGNVYYVKDLDTYVLACASPQWAFYNDEGERLFDEAMETLKKILVEC